MLQKEGKEGLRRMQTLNWDTATFKKETRLPLLCLLGCFKAVITNWLWFIDFVELYSAHFSVFSACIVLFFPGQGWDLGLQHAVKEYLRKQTHNKIEQQRLAKRNYKNCLFGFLLKKCTLLRNIHARDKYSSKLRCLQISTYQNIVLTNEIICFSRCTECIAQPQN